jgi:hypothetical protein
MKRILHRSRHILKAKGRHGTHSPFVYAFVEQVLRAKTKFRVPHELNLSFSTKEINLLARVFQYLNATVVYADADLFPVCEAIKLSATASDIEIKPMGITAKNFQEKDAVICCVCSSENVSFIQTLATQKVITAILPQCHKDRATEEKWEKVYECEYFKMGIDAWYLGLVSNHPDFKRKQFFKLR